MGAILARLRSESTPRVPSRSHLITSPLPPASADLRIVVVSIDKTGGHRGNTERVVARWWRLVASIKALDLLHRAIRAVLHHRTAVAIEKASDRGAFVRRRHLFRLL